jgi:hypothetical protein
MEERIPTELWVAAHLRQCTAKGVPVYVAHKGAAAAGTVIVRIVMAGKGSKVLTQSRDIEGNMGWMAPFESEIVDEARADQYIQRAVQRDPDVWVIEVEDASGTNPFEGKIF